MTLQKGGTFNPLMGNRSVPSPGASTTAFAGNRGEGKYRENYRHLLTEEYLKSVSSLQVDEKCFLKKILLYEFKTTSYNIIA